MMDLRPDAVRSLPVSEETDQLQSEIHRGPDAAGGGKEFVRDDLFVGPGVLTVGEAKTRGAMFLIY